MMIRIVLSGLLMTSAAPAADGSRRVEPDPRASALYRRACLGCHDEDGRAAETRASYPKIPDFTNPAWHASRNDDELARSILHGKGSMKGMKSKIGETEAPLLVGLVRGFSGGAIKVSEADSPAPSPVATASAARPIDAARSKFQRLCVDCHAGDGKGTDSRESFPSIPDFSNDRWHDGRTDAQLLASVLGGKGSEMPSFRDRLSQAEAGALVRFVRGFDPTPGPARPAAPARQQTLADESFDREYKELEVVLKRLADEHDRVKRRTDIKKR